MEFSGGKQKGSMRGSRFTAVQIIGVLKEADAGAATAELCCRHGISPATFDNSKSRFGGMRVNEVRQFRQIEAESDKLKLLLAESTLDNCVLGVLLRKKVRVTCANRTAHSE